MLKDKSLSFKVIVVTWMVTSMFTIIFTAIQIYYEYKDERSSLFKTYSMIQDLYVPSLSESMWIMNRSIIKTQANSLLNFPYVSYIKLYDSEDVFFDEGKRSKDMKKFVLKYKDQFVGHILIGLDTKNLDKKFMKRVMVTVIIQGIKAIVVCIILFFAYELLITGSIRRVSRFLIENPDAATKGNKIDVEEDRDDELGILVKNINNFIEYIFNLNNSLKELNDDLEKKVVERTQELKLKNTELEKTVSELGQTQDQLAASERLASLGKMTAGIAHEIKNPMYILANSASLIKELLEEVLDEIDEESKKKLDQETLDEVMTLCEKSEKTCERVSNIINSMLSLSRGADSSKEDTLISKSVNSAIGFAFDAFKSKNTFSCELEKDLLEEDIKIPLYRSEFSRALINILDNSFYSMKKKYENDKSYVPKLTVKLEKEEKDIKIKVVDNGMGIEDSKIKEIFDPFFTTKPAGEGTGLGMSMTYDIIKKHGGSIDLKSVLGESVTIEITLPIG